ncbi:MAG: carbohydrate kinase family protein [Patescibacteria group bacterium]|nr:carbohydrate kinase family protein [Patescibacteria group bacterium]MBU2509324.1 carbohydrate kinase family protein [Patescibacteria group bacterium]
MPPAKKKNPTYDIISVGESLRDAFYTLYEDTNSCTLDVDRLLLCLEYAEKIPIKDLVITKAAGNSANAAVGASRLELKSALVTWVGKDSAGDDIRNALKEAGVDNQYVIVDPTNPTSEAALLIYKGERTQLVYFQPRKFRMPKLDKTRCIYYSAMGSKHAAFDKVLLKEVMKQPKAYFAFQPGTTHVRSGLEGLKPLIKRSDLFILNKDESNDLLKDGKRTILNLLMTFHKFGAKTVIITDGRNGADAYDGEDHWHMPIFNGKAKERTGAGDSFAIGVTSALLKGKKLPEALRWGTANSWSVVKQIGPQAGLLTTTEMNKVCKKYSKIKAELITHKN